MKFKHCKPQSLAMQAGAGLSDRFDHLGNNAPFYPR